MYKPFKALFLIFCLVIGQIQPVYSQVFTPDSLPTPGEMITVTAPYVPLTLKGLVIHPEDALRFDFIMDTGHTGLSTNTPSTASALKEESLKIMKYFLTALTIPEEDLWVNLSPYEKGRIVEDHFGQTLMGRDLLSQDYILKQLTASVIYPESLLGKKFWSEIYQKASQELGATQLPLNTFNKVWIVPNQAVVWENKGKVMIVKSHLKVMLEKDYIAMQHSRSPEQAQRVEGEDTLRRLVIPVLEKEVNEGKNFAQLRQMYQAMILSAWYKKSLKDSIINKVYANQKKTKGIDSVKPEEVQAIYQKYLTAFKKGAFNYIKEDLDPASGKEVPRKYFSGGFSMHNPAMASQRTTFFQNTLLVLLGVLPLADQKAVAQTAGEEIIVEARVSGYQKAPNTSDNEDDEPIENRAWEKRLADIKALTKRGDNRSVPLLIAGLGDDNWKVRLAAAYGLGTMQDNRALDMLFNRIRNDQKPSARRMAAWAINRIGEPAVNRLVERLNDSTISEYELREVLFAMTKMEINDRNKRKSLMQALVSAKQLAERNERTDISGLIAEWENENLPRVRPKSAESSLKPETQNLGGIALNSQMLDLQINREDNGVSLIPFLQQSLDQMRIDGFIPQIISIKPLLQPSHTATN